MTDEKKDDLQLTMFTMGNDRRYIVGEVLDETEQDMILLHPMVMDISYHGKEGMRVAIYDYMPFAINRLVSVMKRNVHSVGLPNPGIARFYQQYRHESVENKIEEYLEAQITGGPMPDDIVMDFDESPATEHDTKH